MAKFTLHRDTVGPVDPPTSPTTNACRPKSSCMPITAESLVQADTEGLALFGGRGQATPLPMLQLFIICAMGLAEPIAYTQIFPYINQMVEELHVANDPSEIGFYSGLIDSLFSFSQLFTVYQWGRLSDRIGRRPVIFIGLLGVALASSVFGTSTSFSGMVVARALAGMLSGNSAIMKTMIGEITDETNQARAFPLPVLTWSFGCVIGSMLGGALSHPAERYPGIFGGFQFLKDRPFFLPSFVLSCIAVICFLLGYFFLEETLPRLAAAKKAPSLERDTKPLLASPRTPASNYGAVKHYSNGHLGEVLASPASPRSAPTAWMLMSDNKIFTVLSSTFLLAFLSVAWDVAFILFAYTPVKLGGLSKEASEIGFTLSGFGVFGITAALFIFPFLHDRFGSLPLYGSLMQFWPLSFAIMPVLNWVAKHYGLGDTETASGHVGRGASEGNVIVWIGIATLMIVARVANMSWCANSILVKTASPDQATLGAIFGLQQSASNIARSTGPAFVSSLFAISVERQIFGGNLVWIIMCGISFLGVWSASYLAHLNRSLEYDEVKTMPSRRS